MQPYSFNIINKDYFEFTTIAGNRYACYFLSAKSYMANYPQISNKIFMFNIDLLGKSTNKNDTDERIALTVVSILKKFLNSKEYAAVYVCDSSDNKHKARNRKFNNWFKRYDDGTIIKVDYKFSLKELTTLKELTIYNSLLVHKENPLKNKFISAFMEINDDASLK